MHFTILEHTEQRTIYKYVTYYYFVDVLMDQQILLIIYLIYNT